MDHGMSKLGQMILAPSRFYSNVTGSKQGNNRGSPLVTLDYGRDILWFSHQATEQLIQLSPYTFLLPQYVSFKVHS
jgi:hypothetical protein